MMKYNTRRTLAIVSRSLGFLSRVAVLFHSKGVVAEVMADSFEGFAKQFEGPYYDRDQGFDTLLDYPDEAKTTEATTPESRRRKQINPGQVPSSVARPPAYQSVPDSYPLVAKSDAIPEVDGAIPVAGGVAYLIESIQRGDYFCIDTNIWMEPAFEPALRRFFGELVTRKAYFRISAEQRAEVQNIRKMGDPGKVSLSSRALRLMAEAAECQAAVFVEPPKGGRIPSHYLDDHICKQVDRKLRGRNGKLGFASVVTNDVELSGRLKSISTRRRRNGTAVSVMSGREFSILMGVKIPPKGFCAPCPSR